jgi:hypothetical protein
MRMSTSMGFSASDALRRRVLSLTTSRGSKAFVVPLERSSGCCLSFSLVSELICVLATVSLLDTILPVDTGSC